MQVQPNEKEEMVRENELNYANAYSGTSGPIKYMSEEAKEKVHIEIDARMAELEATGLTKEEILHEKSGGVPLGDDPFF